MPLLTPQFDFRRIQEIPTSFFVQHGIRALLLDVDNTLTTHNAPQPWPGVVEWTHKLQEAGFSVIIVSNNTRRRVQAFAAGFDLPFCSRALKPLPVGYVRAARLAGVPCRRCVVVGDQIFTDIVGANLVRMSSVLLTPLQEETGWSFKVRRRLEKPFRKKLSDQERGK